MKYIILSLIVLCFLANDHVSAQANLKTDTLKTITLSPKESKIIRNLSSTDTAFIAGDINLQTEVLKFNPNLIYKYRLDSISSNVHLDYNSHVQSYIDVFTTKRKTEMGKMLGLGHYYFPIFEKALAVYKVPEEFKYLPIIESSMNPMAVSKSGATGLWQFMYTTGKVYGLNIDDFVDERRDPIAASYAAAAYLKDAYQEFGDWLLALAAYNCGSGNVRRAILKVGLNPTFWEIKEHLPAETRSYVPAFIATNYIMNYYNKHDVKIIEEANIQTDSVYVNKYISFQKIAHSLNMDVNDLLSLNPSYKKSIINGSLAQPKRLIIPKISAYKFSNFFEALNADEDLDLKIVSVIDNTQSNITKPIVNSHVVKKGENLTLIANHYLVEVQDLKDWNELKTFDIAVGQTLIVKKAVN
jgi:membrane-bound lytic murein transglycosylase D